ncbi:hypothetical protein [Nocardioides jejuensis]|uniref:hypothetical protein n=1 Tax=Nocardioides jejuensis TaxID=2502782 RepID=UPI001FB31BAE|nr:hypothetical protein [Nocardioides jejuensis]
MAKALLGYMSSDLRDPSRADRLAAEVRRLRDRVGDLEALVLVFRRTTTASPQIGPPGPGSRRCSPPDGCHGRVPLSPLISGFPATLTCS